MKILCPSPKLFSKVALEYLSSKSKLTTKTMNSNTFNRLAINFDAIIIRFNFQITKKIIGDHSRIKFIICPTTGLDHIDLNLCKKHNVRIISLKNQKKFLKNITATAELTIALILVISRNIKPAIDSVLNYKWNQENFRGTELKDKKIGIIGYGRLGKIVAKICNSLSMKVFFFDTNSKIKSNSFASKKTLNYILQKCDIISLHIPLNESNKNFISFNEFKKMKKEATIINTSRAGCLNSNDLINALSSKVISGAAIDVLNEENKKSLNKNKLISYARKNKNLIITPHIGGATHESVEKTDFFVIKKFLKKFEANI